MNRFFLKLVKIFSKGNDIPEPPGIKENKLPAEERDIILLLGDKITGIKMFYEPQGENDWLDTVLTYIILEKSGTINFPFPGDMHFVNVNLDARARDINEEALPKIIGQSIRDLYYQYDEAEPVPDSLAFIELENGYVLHENRMAPHGTGAADLFLYTEDQFKTEKENIEYELRSLKAILLK